MGPACTDLGDMVPSWIHLGSLLFQPCVRPGTILVLSWIHLDSFMGPPWTHLGTLLAPSWFHLGT